MKLQNKLALVTGAGIGIGREVALELAREGADVVLSYHASVGGAESAVAEIRAMGRRALAVRADTGQVSECQALVSEAAAFLGGVDILVNNAGVTLIKEFYEMTEQDFNYLYGINIRGYYFTAQACARLMRERVGGVIINMASVHAYVSNYRTSLYDGTKGAIVNTTRSLALELARDHIRVVGVAPGVIEVPRYFDNPAYSSAESSQRVPWGRVGLPIDIAKACTFLASADADFITGETLIVDGGTTTRISL
jgi:NAD(P)-dependent dehydrogenase (short-subunit alcohol dehydrogenase family)